MDLHVRASSYSYAARRRPADSHAGSNSYGHACLGRYAHGSPADTHGNPADGHARTYRHAYANSDRDAGTDRHANVHAYTNSDIHAGSNTDAYPNAHAHTAATVGLESAKFHSVRRR